MTISTINRIKTVANKINVGDGSIVTIYQNTGLTIGNELITNHKIISFNCFIKNLRAFALINSLAEISLPNFTLDDSETDKLYKTLNTEWNSARKQITLYISNQLVTNPNGQGWFKVGSLSLLNPSGYPYRVYNLMDLFTDNLAIELGDNGKIGVQIEDVGYGLLSATDEVTIHGSYIEEIFVQSPDPSYVSIINSTGTATGTGTTTTPPASVSKPSILNNPLFIISASTLSLANNALVSQWVPNTGSGCIVSQTVSTSQPTFVSSAVNNKSAVYFNGSNKFLSVERTNAELDRHLLPDGDWAIVTVSKPVNPDTGIFASYTQFPDRTTIIITGRKVIIERNTNSSGIFERLIYEHLTNYSDWNICITSKTATSIKVYLNGILNTNNFKPAVAAGSRFYNNSVAIGNQYNPTNPFNGSIAELAVIGTHTTADLNLIGEYYKFQYGINWTTI